MANDPNEDSQNAVMACCPVQRSLDILAEMKAHVAQEAKNMPFIVVNV